MGKKVLAVSLALVLLTMMGVGACGGGEATPPPGEEEETVLPGEEEEASTTSETEIPAHYITYTDEVGLFSISYPPDWEPALFLIEGLEEFTEELITSIEEDIPIEASSCIFFAGLLIETGYMPNVNIVIEPLPGVTWTHDEAVEAAIQGIKAIAQDYHEFSRVKTTISGREATIIDCEATIPQLGSFHYCIMMILVGKTGWCVTCTSFPEEFSKWENDFNAIVRSLRILK